MQIWLYRRRLSSRSGAGQLVQMQAEGLERAGVQPKFAATRGRLKYFLRTGRRAQSLTLDRAREIAGAKQTLFVDHSAQIPEADVVFVHNHAGSAARFHAGEVFDGLVEGESRFFQSLDASARIVANSERVRDALIGEFGFSHERVSVLHPGYRAHRFNPRVRDALRKKARHELGVADESVLIGFVTSGNLRKRGIDCLLEAAALIAANRNDARFLIVGSSELPAGVTQSPLYQQGRLLHRPRSRAPERWYAALDLFLYPAVWEEFGMVVVEAMACGLPVLTSRRVGAAECMPGIYDDWILQRPDADRFAELTLRFLSDPGQRKELVEQGLQAVLPLADRLYGNRAAKLILDQN